MSKPTVSVAMITYGHEEYIKQAIEGVLMQECNFEIELIIANDSSPDNTDNVIKKIIQNHPKSYCIKYTKHDENIGMMPNFVWDLNQCNGKYIALCEGDDYWTDPLKLQKQVDFLEKNDDFSLCFHKIKILKKKRLVKDFITNNRKDITTINDIARINYIHTPSVLFRNGLIKEFPSWYLLGPNGDHPLYILLAQYGKIKFIDSFMAVYRVHSGGVWSLQRKNNLPIIKKTIVVQKLMIDYFNGDIKNILKENLSISLLELSDYYYKENKLKEALKSFKESTLYSHEILFKRYFRYKKIYDPIKKLIFKSSRLTSFIRKKLN